MEEHHYLGAGQPVGDYLRQVVVLKGKPVALLVWGPACYALKDRDLWISWSACQRVERLKLIVQNRRLLLLTAKGQELDRQKGNEAGADLYMTKPFSPDEVLAKAREILNIPAPQ